MSVALLISNCGGESPARLVPIATEAAFTKYWQPAASHLQLHWVPLFCIGITVAQDDIAHILAELTQLRAYFVANDGLSAEGGIVLEIVLRIDELAQTFARLEGCVDLDLWIG